MINQRGVTLVFTAFHYFVALQIKCYGKTNGFV